MTLDGKTLEGVQEGFDTAVEEGWCYKADTVAELGELVGAPDFAQSVAEYNESCARGVDEVFGKPACFMLELATGPFYALEFQPSAWVTIGGVRTNDRLQAIDTTGAVIENLFVAGADNGSTISAPYCDYEGTSLMTAYNAGRLAGMWMCDDIDAAE
jgi:fumarate reductase flavoprotein subunit